MPTSRDRNSSIGDGTPPGAVARLPAGAPCAISADGSFIACGGALWSGPAFSNAARLDRRSADARRLSFSADSRMLAAYVKHPEYDHFEIVLTEVAKPHRITGELLDDDGAPIRVVYPFYTYGDRPAAFSPDGRTIASPLESPYAVWRFDVASRRPVAKFENHGHHDAVDSDDNEFQAPDTITDLTFSPDGRVLASLAKEGTVVLWEAASGRRLQSLRQAEVHDAPHGLRISPDGRLFGFATTRRIELWPPDGAPGDPLRIEVADTYGPSFAFLPRAVVAGNLRAFDRTTGKELPRRIDVPADPVLQLASSADGRIVIAATEQATTVWDAATLWGL